MVVGRVGARGLVVLRAAARVFKSESDNVTARLPLMVVNLVPDPLCKRRPAQMTVQVLI